MSRATIQSIRPYGTSVSQMNLPPPPGCTGGSNLEVPREIQPPKSPQLRGPEPPSSPSTAEPRVFPAHSGDAKATRLKVESDDDYFVNQYKGSIFNYISWPASRGHQGCLPPMIFDFFSIIDQGGDGELSAEELDEAADIIRIAKKAKSNNSAELNYKHMPKVVAEVLAGWDADRSGSVSVSELVSAAEAQRRLSDENRLMKRLLIVAFFVIVFILCATLGICLWAAEQTKDFRPDDAGIQRLPEGTVVATSQAIENVNIAEYASLPLDMLQRAHSVQFSNSGRWHFYQVASIQKNLSGDVTVFTPDQHSISIFQNRTIVLDGVIIADDSISDAAVKGTSNFLAQTRMET